MGRLSGGARSTATRLVAGTRRLGSGLILLGAVAAIAPWWTAAVVLVALGIILLLAGAVLTVFGMRAREAGDGNTALVLAAITGLCGVVLVVQPSAGMALARLILIGYLTASGLTEAALAWRGRGEERWAWMLFGALVSLLGAIVLWTDWPIAGARAIGLVVGAKLASIGWTIVRFCRRLDAVGERLAAVRARFR